MTCSTTSVLLLPGSFAPANLYFPIRDALISQGIDVQVAPLATVKLANDTRTPPSMYDDAAMIVREVEKLADAGKDVVVISHSYSGVPLTQASKGLGKESRKSQGKQGGIVKLAYMTSLVPDVGQSAAEVLTGENAPEEQIENGVDEQGWFFQKNVTQVAKLVFSDLPLDEAIVWAKTFSQHSAQSFTDKTTQAGYLDEDLPLYYLFCENDLVIPPAAQQDGIDLMERLSGKEVNVTRIVADHAPIIAKEDLAIDWIVGLAKGQ